MSEIRATTVSNLAGTGPVTLTGQSASKAWVNFNGGGTIAARDSFNLSSLTDNGTGNYSINVSSAFDSSGYTVLGNALSAAVAGGTYVLGPSSIQTGAFAVAVCRNDENVTTPTDRSIVTTAAHGVLA